MTVATKPYYGLTSDKIDTDDYNTLATAINTITDGEQALSGGVSLTSGNVLDSGAGTGVTTGTGTIYRTSVLRIGDIIYTNILIDLTGLASSAAGDVIGKAGTANSHFGQITAAQNGTILSGRITCQEVPAGGEPDIDVYSAPEATLAEDAAISTSTGEAVLLDAAADWTAVMTKSLAPPAADQYIYLVASGGGDNADYTAGKFLIELFGYV